MFSRSKKFSSLSLSLLLLSLSSPADAAPPIEGADKGDVQVNVSAKERNLLAIEGRRLTSVVPRQPGSIIAEKDEQRGVLYFRLNSEVSAGVVSLFVTDDQNVTYKLILVPRPVAGEEIVLRPPSDRTAAPRSTSAGDGRAASYQRRVKDLVLVMADPELSNAGIDKQDINKDVPLWQEGKLVLATKFLQGDLVGEKYRLTNVSRADMLLVEQELYRRGVRAVAVKDHTLAAGDSTDIYIVRERKENE